ncbi:hypothetical protein J1N35_002360 [Gossypium stocksii]|uniref:Uncharacterized protein n=1 Tax=Gossypium stocksii TaxID=47602 RepID=A0A9D4AMC4_9ROSI|nr:hypothetical protein J1N35_002360 [Gossypium stocksii]
MSWTSSKIVSSSVNWAKYFDLAYGDVKSDASFDVDAGGVMRKQNEDWILGFNHYLGDYLVSVAELSSVMDGLILLKR